jgi:hypothetical protein
LGLGPVGGATLALFQKEDEIERLSLSLRGQDDQMPVDGFDDVHRTTSELHFTT